MPDPPRFELGDGLLNVLGAEADDTLDKQFVNKKEQEDAVLEQLKDQHNFDDIKNAFDERIASDQVEFFYGGDNDNFVRAIEFLSPSSKNREFIDFFSICLGNNVMKNNRLSIHVERGDIFYQNDNTGENFYNFLLAQQHDETAFVPKKFSCRNSFEKYIDSFLPLFSIDDIEKLDLYANKTSKYLFYPFNDYIKAYGNKRRKIKHTQEIRDSIGLQKIEKIDQQLLIEKIIHSAEFKNPYENFIGKKKQL